jgi:hypothetical protein
MAEVDPEEFKVQGSKKKEPKGLQGGKAKRIPPSGASSLPPFNRENRHPACSCTGWKPVLPLQLRGWV